MFHKSFSINIAATITRTYPVSTSNTTAIAMKHGILKLLGFSIAKLNASTSPVIIAHTMANIINFIISAVFIIRVIRVFLSEE